MTFHHNENKHFYGKLKINENIKIINGILWDKEYKWNIYNAEGRLAREQVIPNRPGPSSKARKAKSIKEFFGKFIANETANNIADLTNAKIQLFTEQNPTWNDSDKYSYVKPTLPKRSERYLG